MEMERLEDEDDEGTSQRGGEHQNFENLVLEILANENFNDINHYYEERKTCIERLKTLFTKKEDEDNMRTNVT